MHARWRNGIYLNSTQDLYGIFISDGLYAKELMFLFVVLEKTLESPLDNKEIKTVNPKGNQPWTVIGRTDAEAETPTLCPPDAKSWFTGKDPAVGKGWG